MLKKFVTTLLLAFALSPSIYGAGGSVLGPGDTVKINVHGHPDLSTEAQVSENGTINFPLIGEVEVEGLSKGEAERKIGAALDGGQFIPNPQVNILVTEFRSQQVSVLGEVQKPGKYSLRSGGSLTDLLAQAGGVTEKGGSDVMVMRRQPSGELKRYRVDISGMFRNAGTPEDPTLAPNDIIYVPTAPVFYIYGEVQKPGAYPLESELTVQQALSLGGGLTVRGTERGLRINRKDGSGKVQTLSAELNSKVKEGDVVYVKESLF